MTELRGLDSIRLILFASRRYRPKSVGLRKNEIHCLAYKIREKTELFSGCSFHIGYRGVRSNRIKIVLEMFDSVGDSKIIDNGQVKSGLYFQVSGSEDTVRAEEITSQIDETVIDTVLSELERLEEMGSKDYISEVNKVARENLSS